MIRKCYSVSRILIGENNESISRSWIVYHNGIVAQLTSAAEFFAADDLALLLLLLLLSLVLD